MFAKDVRRAAFARTYSADKNVSIFLGRPPRIHRNYCKIQLPGATGESIREDGSQKLPRHFDWDPNARLDYVADTRWSAMCAILKEEILDLYLEQDHNRRSHRAE